jgi:hypothetical protein
MSGTLLKVTGWSVSSAQGERGVLVPARRERAAQPDTALDDELVHAV